jgi:outer membrane protein OmpA-like peptidoglycan-associated protein
MMMIRVLVVSIGFTLIAAGAVHSTAAFAQSYLDRNASPAQVKRALQGTRSIRPRPAPSPRASTSSRQSRASSGAAGGSRGGARATTGAAAAAAVMPLPPSEGDVAEGPASFRIQFGFNSADLRPEAIPLLDKLGEALTSEDMKDWVFVVEGHTDASGAEQFNLELSQRRAETVRDYLVSKHGIDAARLPARGFGESDLYDPARPTAPINRRVSFAAPESAPETVAKSAETTDTQAPEAASGKISSPESVPGTMPAVEAELGDTVIETGPLPRETAGSSMPAPSRVSPSDPAESASAAGTASGEAGSVGTSPKED